MQCIMRMHFSQHNIKNSKRRKKTGLKWEGLRKHSGTNCNKQLTAVTRRNRGKAKEWSTTKKSVQLTWEWDHTSSWHRDKVILRRKARKTEPRNPLRILGQKQRSYTATAYTCNNARNKSVRSWEVSSDQEKVNAMPIFEVRKDKGTGLLNLT